MKVRKISPMAPFIVYQLDGGQWTFAATARRYKTATSAAEAAHHVATTEIGTATQIQLAQYADQHSVYNGGRVTTVREIGSELDPLIPG